MKTDKPKNMKPRLFISFSGGRTSALMTKLCFEKYGETHDIEVLFANTGSEHPNTLEFVHRCDQEFGWGVVWIEAFFNLDHGEGVTPRVVTYETASRNNEPFHWFIKKNGLPSPENPSCTNRLKEDPMHKYIQQVLGWEKGSYDTAIGLRADEMDRVNAFYKSLRFIYPLLDMGVTGEMVKLELMTWDFDLDLPSDAYGNCVGCWKKTKRKLLTLITDAPEHFAFWKTMETQYRYHKPSKKMKKFRLPRVIQRKHKTTKMLEFEAQQGRFTPYRDASHLQTDLFDPIMDHSLGCGESCEVGHG